jgi:hypothetical protein
LDAQRPCSLFWNVSYRHLAYQARISCSTFLSGRCSFRIRFWARWTLDTFDEGSGTVAGDSSGGGVNGSLNGSANWVSGRVGGAIDLTSGGASVSFGASPSYIENKSSLTVAFWVRAAPDAPAYVPIFHNQTNSSQVTFQIVKSVSGTIEFKVFTSSSKTVNSANDAASGLGWNHVVGVYDGAELFLYINGSRSGGTVAQTGITKDTFGQLLLMNGSFDDVRIYDRALSASEVNELYAYAGSGGDVTPPAPVSTPTPPPPPPPSPVSTPTPPPVVNTVNGSCGTTQNICTSGTLSGSSQNSTQYIWSCLGSGGGTNASCSLNIPSVPVENVPVAQPGTCSTVSYFSRSSNTEIRWTFDKAYTCGKFANGDWWIVGPAVITSITPNYTGKYHGWEVNPLPIGAQGFDGRNNLLFSASKVPSLPYTAKPGDSVVKAVSRNIANENCEYSDRPCLLTAGVLTVLGSVPPDNGATVFRPPYVGTSKPLYSVNSLRLNLLPSLPKVPLAGNGDMANIKYRFRPLQLDHISFGAGRVLRPIENLPDYGGDIGRDTNSAILKLALDYPIDQKKEALIPLVQYGVDLYHMHILGHTWNQGGLTTGRRPLLAFTAIMLDQSDMKSLLRNNKYDGLGGRQMMETDAKVYRGKGGVALYGDIGTAEYGYWSMVASGGTRGDKLAADPYGYIDGGARPGDNYTNIFTPSTKAATIIAHLIPSIRDAWYPSELQEVIDYADRYYTFGLWTLPDPCAPYSGNMDDYGKKFGPNGSGGCITGAGRHPSLHGAPPPEDSRAYGSAFVTQMWNTYRGYSSGGFPANPISVVPVPVTTPVPGSTPAPVLNPTPLPLTPTPIPTPNLMPVSGSCGNYDNTCNAGIPNNLADTSTQYLWQCLGERGGGSAYCSASRTQIPIPTPAINPTVPVPGQINGYCGPSVNRCISGTFRDAPDSGVYSYWSCIGQNGGTNMNCNISKQVSFTDPNNKGLSPIIPTTSSQNRLPQSFSSPKVSNTSISLIPATLPTRASFVRSDTTSANIETFQKFLETKDLPVRVSSFIEKIIFYLNILLSS